MKTWSRAAFACGSCASILPANSPRLRFWFTGKDGKPFAKDRCEKCAGEPVPDDLPVRPANYIEPFTLTFTDEDGIERPLSSMKPMTHISRGQALPLDWRKKAAGE